MYAQKILLSLLLASFMSAVGADGPTMGWSSWNTYRINISDSLIMSQADAMVQTGLADAGYRYINIDDGYFGGRDSSGRLLIHPGRFPKGMKPVTDHIHSLGLKAGIYSDAGQNTCGNYWDGDTIARGVGLYGHDDADAEMLFGELGFDFIKVDFCGGDARQNTDRLDLDEKSRYEEIRNAIRRTGRDDVRLNICRWDYPGTWVDSVGFSWRISHDINASWKSVSDIIAQCIPLSAYCRNGGFNDMDMLEVGRGLTPDEDITHFALWCIMSSPLLIGCDLNSIDDATLKLLSNPELIAVNQDSLHLQAYPAVKTDDCFILVKDFRERNALCRVFAVYNSGDSTRNITVNFADIDLGGNVHLRNILECRDEGDFTGSFNLIMPPHATRIFEARADSRLMRRIYEAETGYIPCYSEISNPIASRIGSYEYDDSCSGGIKVSGLGLRPENCLLWHDVMSDQDGDFSLRFDCISAGTTSMTVNVNGEDYGVLTFTGRGSGELTVHLSEGSNEIRVYNATGSMPDIDRMIVEPRK